MSIIIIIIGLTIVLLLILFAPKLTHTEKFSPEKKDILSLVKFKQPISQFARIRILSLIKNEISVKLLPLFELRTELQKVLSNHGYQTIAALTDRENDYFEKYNFNWAPKIEMTDNITKYYSMVYPNASDIDIRTIQFLYSCAPRDLTKSYEPLIDPDKTKDYLPVQLYATWSPIWYARKTFSINLYPPNRWWDYENLNKYTSNLPVEALHVNDDNPWYPVYGLWLYITQGTGVFYNLGRTLQSMNKIHSLYLLGLSIEEIAHALIDKHYFYNPDRPSATILSVAQKFEGNTDLEKVAAMVSYIIHEGRDYSVDRVNNTADFDELIATRAKELGYDSVQFQVQANGKGGWAHECVFVGESPLIKEKESTWAGWKNMAARMTLEDPNYLQCSKRCTPRLNDIVTCEEQQLPVTCLENGSQPPSY